MRFTFITPIQKGSAENCYLAWASADFFQGRAKWGREGGAQKHTIFFQKSRKHTIIVSQGGVGGQVPLLALPCGHPCY